MRSTKSFFIFAVLLCGTFCAFCSIATRPSVSVWTGFVFCHPTADYLKKYPGDPSIEMPKLRTLFSAGFDAEIIDFTYVIDRVRGTSVSAGIGLSFLDVSESLPFGISVLKPYSGLGYLVRLNYKMGDVFSMGLRFRRFDCAFTGTKTHFIVNEFECVPRIKLYAYRGFDVFADAPLTVSVKADAVSLRLSASLTVCIDSGRFGGRR